MNIQRIIDPNAPLCSSRVLYSEQYERIKRQHPSSRRSITCTRKSTYTIDNNSYCTIHAGMLALENAIANCKDKNK